MDTEEYTYDGMVLDKQWFPLEGVKKMKDLKTTIDDVCIATYPKSGTTWTQQILAQIYSDVCRPDVPLMMNVPFIEMSFPGSPDGLKVDRVQATPSPRLFKTHLPARYFQRQVELDQLKVIFVIRDIRDVLVSFYHHYKMMKMYGPYTGDWHDFFKLFREDKVQNGNFFDVVPSWLRLCDRRNVLLVRYEDLKKDIVGEMGRIARFCGRDFDVEQLREMAGRCSFAAMKDNSNDKTNMASFKDMFKDGEIKFFRKGTVGDWKNHFTQEELEILDGMIQQCPEYMKVYAGSVKDAQ